MLVCCGFMILPAGATSPPEIPLDSHGLPLWEIRAYDDFPVRIVLDDRPELNALLAAVPLASFHREQIRVVYDSPESSHLVFEARVTAAEAQSLVSAGYRFERIPDRGQELRREIERDWASRAHEGFQTKTRNDIFYYPTHAEIGQILAAAAADHPDIAHDFFWGNSVQGRQLWGIVISDNVGSEEPEPEIRLSSTMHGDEPPGMVMLLNLVEYLTDYYGQPGYEDVTDLVDNYEIHILPLHNPDGYIAGTRRNANNIDLNRNFPVPDGSIGDDGTWTEEIETFAFKAYSFHHDFVISENGHSGALVVNYPWDDYIGGSSYTPLDNRFQLEEELFRLTSLANQIENPFEQSLFLLVYLSYLQAFWDVNKRTARLAANIPLLKKHLFCSQISGP